jgi:hypothetical protein
VLRWEDTLFLGAHVSAMSVLVLQCPILSFARQLKQIAFLDVQFTVIITCIDSL